MNSAFDSYLVTAISSHSPLDFFGLRHNPWIVNGCGLQISDNLLCLFDAAVGDEPSR